MSRKELEKLCELEYSDVDVCLYDRENRRYVLFLNSLGDWLRVLNFKTKRAEFFLYTKLETLKGDDSE